MSRRFGISFDTETSTLSVRIHHSFSGKIQPIPPDAPIIKALMGEFGFTNFDATLETAFGFNQGLRCIEEKEWIRCLCPLTAISSFTNEDCENCGGIGRSDADGECLFCGGEGKKEKFSWDGAYVNQASLALLFEILTLVEEDSSSNLLQLVSLNIGAGRGMGYSSISGMLSPHFLDWLESPPLDATTKARDAMKRAYLTMFPRARYLNSQDFQPSLGKRRMCLEVPGGNGCIIFTDPNGWREGQLSDHNIDSPAQQLALLAGLATLHDLVDQTQSA